LARLGIEGKRDMRGRYHDLIFVDCWMDVRCKSALQGGYGPVRV
jgi:hypothetical protein